LLLQRLSKTPSAASQQARKSPSPEHKPASPQTAFQKNQGPEEAVKTIEINEYEEYIQRKIMKDRTKLLWPGIWTFFALTGTYAGFAYLDARYGKDTSSSTQLPERAKLPQDWYLTPTIMREGIKAGWNELDKLTVGIVVASIAIQLTRKSPLPFWEKLMHITGEKKYTAFTYPFVHSSWGHLAQNMFVLCWFMPGVVRYLDCDYFHAAALFASVPLITSYLQHFAFRWGPATGVPLNMGSSGAVAAMFGAYCVAYADEKVWLPSFIVVRLDAKYWGVLYAMWQLARLMATPKGGNRPAFLVSFARLW
jgi:membrane associated rhomboid family serine protease